MTFTLHTELLENETIGTEEYGLARFTMYMEFATDVANELLPNLAIGFLTKQLDTPAIPVGTFAHLVTEELAKIDFETAKFWDNVWMDVITPFLELYTEKFNCMVEEIDGKLCMMVDKEFMMMILEKLQAA